MYARLLLDAHTTVITSRRGAGDSQKAIALQLKRRRDDDFRLQYGPQWRVVIPIRFL